MEFVVLGVQDLDRWMELVVLWLPVGILRLQDGVAEVIVVIIWLRCFCVDRVNYCFMFTVIIPH